MKTTTRNITRSKGVRTINKHLDYYLSLPYVVETSPIPEDDGGGYVACIPVLGRWSAVGDGETPADAYQGLFASLPSLFAEWIERNIPIPEPKKEEELPSGILSLRLSRSLHARILREKDMEGVSINAYIVSVLEQATASASTLRFLEGQIERQEVAMKLTTSSRGRFPNHYRFKESGETMQMEALEHLLNQQMVEGTKKTTETNKVRINPLRCASA